MARDLERLKEVLWTQFEKAVEKQPRYEDRQDAGSSTPTNFGIAGRQSIASLAQALVDVERELREREEQKSGFTLVKGPEKQP